MTTALWLLPVLAPLAACGLVLTPVRGRSWLLAIAPLPALAAGLTGLPGDAPDLEWLVLDVVLRLEPLTRVLLVMTALLWTAAGASARAKPGRDRGFAAAFLLAMTGNIALLLAGDAVTFYTSFAVMTFAAYGLVVHDRTASALRAGRIYIALAVLGEVAVFAGLSLAVAAAGSTDLAELGPAIATSAQRDLTVGLLIAGFGVKAGIVPLHVWLPLAHPAAPVPASAVLSGAMIKAGLLGWLQVLPLGDVALPGWSALLVVLGTVTAAVGIGVGLTQRNAKALLAYSSISQMGMITVLVGVAVGVPDAAPLAMAGAALYALHHGFAKGALFLGVGLLRTESRPGRHRLLLAGSALAALSLAGLPLTSGTLAKVALKDAVGLLPTDWAGSLALLLSLLAGGTTVLMARLLHLTARPPQTGRADTVSTLALGVVLGAVAVATWVLPRALLPDLELPTLSATVIWGGLWPVLLGLATAAVAWRSTRHRRVDLAELPPGDLVVLAEASARRLGELWQTRLSPAVFRTAERGRALKHQSYLAVLPGGSIDRLDRRLTRWRAAGVLFALVTVALVAVMGAFAEQP